jgi:Protein of unknown function (DUF1203)
MQSSINTPSHFRITGLPAETFQHLFALTDEQLAAHHAQRYVADAKPGYPDRIEMRDAEVGESVILVNHMHLPDDSPYRSSHAVFVLEGATESYDATDRVPDVLRGRMLSLRAFDDAGMMLDADLVAGADIEPLIIRFFANPAIAFIHVHYAKRGCYACRIDRVAA